MDFDGLIRLVRDRSPYYSHLYKNLPETGLHPEDLPIADQKNFWKSNEFGKQNRLLTAPLSDGIVFKSGGTSGSPKFSAYSRKEWAVFTRDFGKGLQNIGLEPGDRVANLFYAGDLYASFSFINRSLSQCPVPCVIFPVSGNGKPDRIIEIIIEYQIEVIMGVPATVELLLSKASGVGKVLPVRKIFYGGEPASPQQCDFFRHCLGDDVLIGSVGHASVDGGQIGYADKDCAPGEHYSFREHTWLEIIDPETGCVIRDPGVTGSLFLTSYYRTLMPVLRYPVGDRGHWTDYQKRRYRLAGRSGEVFRLGSTTLRWCELEKFPDSLFPDTTGVIQVRLKNDTGKDRMQLVMSRCGHSGASGERRLTELFHEKYPGIVKDTELGIICPVESMIVPPGHLAKSPRTGKLLRVIDERSF